ncbi:DUF4041 domain-containing protein [Eggerthia catenaformis]|uniref:DUF4041 domain-containing protein n=1 Tax=Eggerthia catenaformis TaxID=31973 RepID=UPI003F9FC18F
MGLFNKKELERITQLERMLYMKDQEIQNNNKLIEDLKGKDIQEINAILNIKENERFELLKNIQELNNQKDLIQKNLFQLNQEIISKKQEIDILNNDVEMAEFGFYKPHYNCLDSASYANEIKKIRNQQKDMVKNKIALFWSDDWALDGSKSKGRAMNNDNMKMYLRAYNNECDNLISKVKFNNINKIRERIQKIGVQLDNLNKRNRIHLNYAFYQLKEKELELCYEYERKKQEEKEILREQREQEREEAKLQAEIKAARAKINKDITQFNKALKELLDRSDSLQEDEIADWKNQINDIRLKIDEKNAELEDIDYREANAKAGHVYIISNVGAFGEDVFKIGMTRRLEPQDRIDELGSASVPFKFDVHAMIFSEDAPKLESMLHKAFEKNKINLINQRKEFFKVKIEEIKKVVHENFDPLVQFKDHAEAEQYRESQKLRELN